MNPSDLSRWTGRRWSCNRSVRPVPVAAVDHELHDDGAGGELVVGWSDGRDGVTK